MLRFRIVKKEGIEFRQALLFHFIQAVSRNTGLPKWEDQQVSEKACQTLFSAENIIYYFDLYYYGQDDLSVTLT